MLSVYGMVRIVSGFEVKYHGVSHVVDLGKWSCSCRLWDLTGIPCLNAMKTIMFMNYEPKNYLAKWYKHELYTTTYSHLLKPVAGAPFWDHVGNVNIVPPDMPIRRPGRQALARRRDMVLSEPSKARATRYCRRGLPTHCSCCGAPGHDVRACPTAPPPPSNFAPR